MIPVVYRDLLRDAQARRLLSGLGVSALGDGMSMVSVAWLAVLIAPARNPGVFVGLAVASYSLPGAVGAIIMVSSPLGTAAGGPIVATLGAAWTLTASGAATVLLAVSTGIIWARKSQPNHADRHAPTETTMGSFPSPSPVLATANADP